MREGGSNSHDGLDNEQPPSLVFTKASEIFHNISGNKLPNIFAIARPV
jgi:hypothetical protein